MSAAQTPALAVVLAGLFASAAATAAPAAPAATVMCSGINGCKGQSACATAASACKGHNACKGTGWLPVASEKECTDKGGKVVPAPDAKTPDGAQK